MFSLFNAIKYEKGSDDSELLRLAKLSGINEAHILEYFTILNENLKVVQSRYGYSLSI